MRWRLIGTEMVTGKHRVLNIEADSQQGAEALARLQRVDVSEITQVPEPPVVPYATVVGAENSLLMMLPPGARRIIGLIWLGVRQPLISGLAGLGLVVLIVIGTQLVNQWRRTSALNAALSLAPMPDPAAVRPVDGGRLTEKELLSGLGQYFENVQEVRLMDGGLRRTGISVSKPPLAMTTRCDPHGELRSAFIWIEAKPAALVALSDAKGDAISQFAWFVLNARGFDDFNDARDWIAELIKTAGGGATGQLAARKVLNGELRAVYENDSFMIQWVAG